MNGWLWLAGATLAAAGAALIGVPAWTAVRARRRRDLNAERYLAWRGRADRSAPERAAPRGERWRLWIAAALALAAIGCLAAFGASG